MNVWDECFISAERDSVCWMLEKSCRERSVNFELWHKLSGLSVWAEENGEREKSKRGLAEHVPQVLGEC